MCIFILSTFLHFFALVWETRGAVLHYLKILLDFIQLSLNNNFDNDSVGLLSECNSNRITFQKLSFGRPHVGQIFKIFVVFVCGFGRMRTGGGL